MVSEQDSETDLIIIDIRRLFYQSSMATSSIYSLNNLDNPGNVLVSCLLNGDNYLTWSRLMRTALRAKNKLGFIDRTIEKPTTGDPTEEQWNICNSMIVAWISNTLEKDLQPSIACIEDAKVLWDDLKVRFSQSNETHIYQIKSEICLLRQEGRTISAYYSQLKGL